MARNLPILQKLYEGVVFWEMINGKKRSHWIWYVFPTSKSGLSDPYQVKVHKYDKYFLSEYFKEKNRAKRWERMLGYVNKALHTKGNNKKLLFSDYRDRDRIYHFCKETSKNINIPNNKHYYKWKYQRDRLCQRI